MTTSKNNHSVVTANAKKSKALGAIAPGFNIFPHRIIHTIESAATEVMP